MPDQATVNDSLIGLDFGHYRILERIGSGGMGVVYRAYDAHLEREVAIKVLNPGTIGDDVARKRFRHEAHALSKLNHPNIATVHDFDTQGECDFLVMEYIPGVTLSEKLARGSLPEKEVMTLGLQLAEGLCAAHEHAVVHRDVKPGNLRLTTDGRLKILDFGLAKLRQPSLDESRTATTLCSEAFAGTLPYMAPEQVLGGEIDARTDIHAAGAVLYEMATGQRAFPTVERSQLTSAILQSSPRPAGSVNPKLSSELSRIIGKCLEREPENRYQSAKELAIDLRRLPAPASASPPSAAPRARKAWVSKAAVAAGLVVVASLIATGVLFVRSRNRHALTERDTIVLSDFNNTTSDSVFDDTLKQGLSVQLEQSPFLNLLSDSKANDTLKLMGRPAGDRLTPEVTREVCQRTGSKAMLTGSIAGLGSQYVIGLKAVTCDTGDVLAEAQEQAAGKESVLKALDAAAVGMRSKLGESLSSVQKYATPLEEATTLSLEALKSYSVGAKVASTEGVTVALPFFQRAVQIDPNFARAYSMMAGLYGALGEGDREAENARKAYDLREKVSERERFDIEGNYYSALGDFEKLVQNYKMYEQAYPRDFLPHMNLGGISGGLGDWEKALEEYREALRLEPTGSANYVNLGVAYMFLNRLDEAEAVFKKAEERGLADEFLSWCRYWLAFLRDDTAQMARLVSAATGKPATEDMLLAAQADTEGWYGRLKSANELTGRAMDSAEHNDAKERAAGYQAEAALREVEAGNRELARAEAQEALKLAPNRDVRAIAALALARAGDTAGVEKLVAELDKTYPVDTLVHRYWLPTIRAGIALERKDPNHAIELLKIVSPVELGQPTNIPTSLCPVYVRGEAYLMLHDGNRAAAEFQKFIDHRGLVLNFPWGALARLGLARAYAMEGSTAKARTAYQDFLTLWKDADPDVPILKQAKAEYANLQ